ncbi:hypothetical protein RFI05_18510 [Acinetobacter baumannii]|uniref:hypothetical protein n=1 Tax=Acinetobacter baumannii TaxID=470 RepID=UPI00280E0024|nr:hypothetical protein [Acinetobacter baumannii]MDQ8869225.1 hypothetical protein [Acinetobacter baumannii]MDQ9951590.1 hypothetical protein [Acinetobacter baumannii]
MSEKQINMSDAQYILSTKLILVPFLQIKISRASSEFDSVKGGLTAKYGAPNGDYNFLRSKSIWNQPNEWMMGLYKEERTLAATWEPEEPNGVKNIILKAKAKSTNEGYITVAYEFFNTESCYKEQKVKDISGL